VLDSGKCLPYIQNSRPQKELLIVKRLLRLVWARWKRIAAFIGRIQTRILLTIFYFFVAGPAWVSMKLVGKDPLNRRARPRSDYWTDYRSSGDEMERARRQF